jgi:competence protein ComEA
VSIKKILIEYFSFTRKERVGFIVIIILIVLVWFLPSFLQIFSPEQKNIPGDTSWIAAVKQLEKLPATREGDFENDNTKDRITASSSSSKNELFYFDPNRLSSEGWKKLGIRDKTIQTIKNYLSKGGHFKNADDLQRVYGLHTDEFERLKSYVKIDPANSDGKLYNYTPTKTTSYPKIPYSKEIIDINTADTTAFISLPGIGSKLAARIVNFRERLGGFYSIDQVKETYGLPDSTFEKIRNRIVLNDTIVKKLNINTATKDELKTHPYIKWNLANAIVEYRNQHGNFSAPEELQNIQFVTSEIFLKLRNYIVIE